MAITQKFYYAGKEKEPRQQNWFAVAPYVIIYQKERRTPYRSKGWQGRETRRRLEVFCAGPARNAPDHGACRRFQHSPAGAGICLASTRSALCIARRDGHSRRSVRLGNPLLGGARLPDLLCHCPSRCRPCRAFRVTAAERASAAAAPACNARRSCRPLPPLSVPRTASGLKSALHN